MKNKFIIIKTTYPKLSEAKKIAKILLEKKFAACVQLQKIESMFFWQNKLTQSKEILVTIKTKANFYQKIEKEILANHSYQIPEIIAISIDKILPKYQKWLENETAKKI